uniref:P22.4 n=1 Tax=Soybean mild yellows Bangladesh virus TaxID=3074303 RepID=A0AA51UNX8_9VIRU|nr:p22.4 [Soybean mild yellows Bangladesh virus]
MPQYLHCKNPFNLNPKDVFVDHKEICGYIDMLRNSIKSVKHGEFYPGCDSIEHCIELINTSHIDTLIDIDLLMIGHRVTKTTAEPQTLMKLLFYRENPTETIIADLWTLERFFNAYNSTLQNKKCELMPARGLSHYLGGGLHRLITSVGTFWIDSDLETYSEQHGPISATDGVFKVAAKPLRSLYFRQFYRCVH